MGGLFGLPFLTDWSLLGTTVREGAIAGATELLKAARDQIGVTTLYDPAYVSLDYPGGDVPEDRGVCIDVVIRAYREAFEFDFQKAIHEDMKAHFGAYPKTWGLTRTDRNIDHRRVPNLEAWLFRHGHELLLTEWKPGDLMTCKLGGSLPHVGLVARSADKNAKYVRLIHNIGRGTEDAWLQVDQFTNFCRFRFFPEPAPA